MGTLPSALVGYTGFVGGHLASQKRFDEFYNSKNIGEIEGRQFNELVVAAMPAAMWIANQNPADDRAALDRLLQSIMRVRAQSVVLISTVCVYSQLSLVDESSPIDESAQTPYGYHRFILEQEFARSFPNVLCVRLPGLFGKGLKKNAVYDLLNSNQVEKLNPAATYQFYDLEWLWGDIQRSIEGGLDLVNFVTEPVSLEDVAKDVFGITLPSQENSSAAQFNVTSRHAELFGGDCGYLYSRQQVLDAMQQFVKEAQGASLSEAAR